MASEEGGNFVAIATDRHGTPTAAMRAGIIIEEETAGRIGTSANRGVRPFDEEFSGGTGDGREEPFEATFPRDKLKGPGAVVGDEFVVAFRDAQDFVDGLGPRRWERIVVDNGSENGAERFAQAKDTKKDSIDGLGFGEEQGS